MILIPSLQILFLSYFCYDRSDLKIHEDLYPQAFGEQRIEVSLVEEDFMGQNDFRFLVFWSVDDDVSILNVVKALWDLEEGQDLP